MDCFLHFANDVTLVCKHGMLFHVCAEYSMELQYCFGFVK